MLSDDVPDDDDDDDEVDDPDAKTQLFRCRALIDFAMYFKAIEGIHFNIRGPFSTHISNTKIPNVCCYVNRYYYFVLIIQMQDRTFIGKVSYFN